MTSQDSVNLSPSFTVLPFSSKVTLGATPGGALSSDSSDNQNYYTLNVELNLNIQNIQNLKSEKLEMAARFNTTIIAVYTILVHIQGKPSD